MPQHVSLVLRGLLGEDAGGAVIIANRCGRHLDRFAAVSWSYGPCHWKPAPLDAPPIERRAAWARASSAPRANPVRKRRRQNRAGRSRRAERCHALRANVGGGIVMVFPLPTSSLHLYL